MGQFRVNITELVGVKVDRKMLRTRLMQLGITDPLPLKRLMVEMEKAQVRAAFLKVIGASDEKQ